MSRFAPAVPPRWSNLLQSGVAALLFGVYEVLTRVWYGVLLGGALLVVGALLLSRVPRARRPRDEAPPR